MHTPIRPTVIGFANGCFDMLHQGHILLLQTAANHCDALVIAVNTDDYCRTVKGHGRPAQTLRTRMQAIRQACQRLPVPVSVLILTDPTPARLLAQIQPDVYVIGSDYRGHSLPGRDHCGRIHIVERLPGISTTAILQPAPA